MDHIFDSEVGGVPRIKTDWNVKDRIGTIRMRLGIGRYRYRIKPGIYAIGNPNKSSRVLVSANYKLTIDVLRKELKGLDLWLLVLDTKGINVWCAAGKGAFGTDELVKRLNRANLVELVGHREIIVPQLGAVGVSAHEVKKRCGFKVVYGPARASDIKKFLENNGVADEKMRTVTFTTFERLELTPVEFTSIIRDLPYILLLILFISGIGTEIFSVKAMIVRGGILGLFCFFAIISGAVLTPVFLPWLPTRVFSIKGGIVSAVFTFLGLIFLNFDLNHVEKVSIFLLTVAISSFLALNFTGSTPFTSPSGVEREMKFAIPVQLLLAVAGIVFWIWGAFK